MEKKAGVSRPGSGKDRIVNYQTINDNAGNPAFVVVPIDEWEDIVLGMQARATKTAVAAGEDELLPQEYADRLLNGENPVRVYRDLRGMSQEDLARAADVKQPYISAIENGKSAGAKTLKSLAAALGVHMEDLA